MDTTPTSVALTPRKAWLVGGGLALVAAASLATALALKGPAPASVAAEPRETIVSTKSPTSRERIASSGPAGESTRTTAATDPAAARPTCAQCAVVQAVTAIERRGEPTGLGAVGGAVAGGVLGHQMGGGSGKDAMTVIGAVGGGVAGHHMERKLRSTTEYLVRVKMADGSSRTLSHPSRLAVGSAVRIDGERLVVQARTAPAPSRVATQTAQSAPTAPAAAAPAAERPRSMAEAKRL